MKKILSAVIILLLFTTLSLLVVRAQDQSSITYAYIVQGSDQNQLVRVDALSGSSRIQTANTGRAIPGFHLYQAISSPDGRWFATLGFYTTTDGQNLLVQIENVATGDVRNLVAGAIRTDAQGVADSQVIAWSPDSQRLAINFVVDGDGEIFIHSIASNSTINLTNDKADQYQIAWSNISTQIAATTRLCQSDDCVWELDVYNVTSGAIEKRIDLTSTAYPLFAPACALSWSPDDQYISFVSTCDSALELPKDIYVWNLSNDAIVAVTQNTAPVFQIRPGSLLQGIYESIWIDDTSLLIGSRSFVQNQADDARTAITKLPDLTEITLANSAFREFALNRDTGALAFQTMNDSQLTGAVAATPASIVVVAVSRLELGFESSAFHANTMMPKACNMAWSPEGEILAYTVHEADNCLANLLGIVFLDDAGNVLAEHSLDALGTLNTVVLPVGWIEN